jgi:hypothetical protein
LGHVVLLQGATAHRRSNVRTGCGIFPAFVRFLGFCAAENDWTLLRRAPHMFNNVQVGRNPKNLVIWSKKNEQ